LARSGYLAVRPEKAVANLIKALGKGVLKVMSKMGISTVAGYHGAQVFEAVGLDTQFVDRYFTGTSSKLRHRPRGRGRGGGAAARDRLPARRCDRAGAPHPGRRWRVPV